MTLNASIKHLEDLVPPGSWAGRRCFIVAGGPSLRDFDFSLLEGELTIGINRAFCVFSPTINYSTDPEFYSWAETGQLGETPEERQDNLKRWKEYKGIKAFIDIGMFPYPEDIVRVRGQKGVKEPSFNLSDGIISGPNSAYAAICLAVALGSKEIYVLGLDLSGENGKQAWWHSGYPTVRNEQTYVRPRERFAGLATKLEEMGVRVVNLSPFSMLTCWRKKHWSYLFKTLHVKTYLGFGDNLYMLPFVKRKAKEFKRVYIETPFPQLYEDIPNALFLKAETKLHAQSLAENAWTRWANRPSSYSECVDFYRTTADSSIESVPERFAQETGYWDIDMSIEVKDQWRDQAWGVLKESIIGKAIRPNGRLCVVKQPTFRKEWYVETRNPKPEYLQLLINRVREAGYYTVSVADLREGEEWTDGPELDVDLRLHHKELDLFGVIGLFDLADLIIGYPSFFLPLGLALQKKMLMVFGGCGRPSLFHSERLYDLSNYRYVAPDPFCHCMRMVHDPKSKRPKCNKEIPIEKLLGALDSLIKEPVHACV